MAINKRLLVKPPSTGITPSEHFGAVLYEGDGTTSHSINGGKFGAAFYGNGSNSYIDFGDNIFKFDEFSVSFWINVSSFVNNQVIYNHYDELPSQSAGVLIRTNSSGNIFVDGWTPPTTYGGNVTSTSTLSANTWYHIGITLTQSQVKIYINGSLDKTGSISGFGYHSTHNFVLGAFLKTGGSPSSFFNGKIDQFRIFQKVLSSSEVSTLYAETAATSTSLDPLSEDTTDTLQVLGDSSCIATYRFENDETDLSGNYNITGTQIQYAAGRYGQAVSMNGGQSAGTSSLLQITNSITTPSELSLSIWFKKNATLNAQNIFNFDRNVGGTGLQLYINAGDVFVFRITTSNTNHFSYTGSTGIYNGWNHVVITWQNQASGQAKLYLNNNLETTQTSNQTGAISFPGNNQFVGSESGGASGFSGELDQFRIFNKVLSAAEVTTLYNENSLVASYRFEGNANDDTRNYDGTAYNVTYEYGLGFTPDFVWCKTRSATGDHNLTDSTRGVQKGLNPNTTAVEGNQAPLGVTSFDTGGFTVSDNSGGGASVNGTGQDYVAWCLKANGGTTSSNTDGTNTSTVQVNSDAGFSIVQGTSSGGYPTVNSFGHGLGVTPAMIIIKQTNGIAGWPVWHQSFSNTAQDYLSLNLTDAKSTSQYVWGNSAPTSSVFSITDGWTLNVGGTFIAYCFAEVEGFSKFGSYTGNGSTDGPIVETGFEPAFLMVKRTDSADGWIILDNKRDLTNPRDNSLKADESAAEEVNSVNRKTDFLSNGFQLKHSHQGMNASGGTYLYMAFAADPDTEQPTVAKSFTSVAYTGTGTNQKVEGLGFAPNLVWIKSRSTTNPHVLHDTVRGIGNVLYSNLTNAEADESAYFTSVGYDYLQFGTNAGNYNNTGTNYVAWAWKADDNEPTINTGGSIDSLVSANANAGFSVVKWTGNATNSTVGHGLSSTPEFIIMKNASAAGAWLTWHKDYGGGDKYMYLNSSNAVATQSQFFNSTVPTSTVFSLGTHGDINGNGNDIIAYCFHSVAGYSKIGSYTGTGSSNSITGLGFQPDWIMAKEVDGVDSWEMVDSARGINKMVYANGNNAEVTNTNFTSFDSDGFTVSSLTSINENGKTYIYMAFKIN